MEHILSYYFERPEDVLVQPITEGLINDTFQVSLGINRFILQKINTSIFKSPEVIISNTLAIGQHLKNNNYSKEVVEIIPNRNGNFITFSNGEIWRMTKYIPNSVCINKVQSKEQAFEAAKCISEFHRLLNDFSTDRIQSSIPGFLDYKKRVNDFKLALKNANEERQNIARAEIDYINAHLSLIDEYLQIEFPTRVVHADAKIGNFLFDANDSMKPIALIDWDTILPGNVLCDFGDMIRTYSNLKVEDDPEGKNNFSLTYYQSVKDGFLYHLSDVLTEKEIEATDLTAFVVILIQAIRFLTDYLNGDIYYHTTRENQNLDRTINQINLLKAIEEELCIH